ncbi:Ankyrin repeat domain-containing protein 6, partial [Bienertia sinuspersici]
PPLGSPEASDYLPTPPTTSRGSPATQKPKKKEIAAAAVASGVWVGRVGARRGGEWQTRGGEGGGNGAGKGEERRGVVHGDRGGVGVAWLRWWEGVGVGHRPPASPTVGLVGCRVVVEWWGEVAGGGTVWGHGDQQLLDCMDTLISLKLGTCVLNQKYEDLLYKTPDQGNSIVHIAVRYWWWEFIYKAISLYTHLLQQKNDKGNTPFHEAAALATKEIVKHLI